MFLKDQNIFLLGEILLRAPKCVSLRLNIIEKKNLQLASNNIFLLLKLVIRLSKLEILGCLKSNRYDCLVVFKILAITSFNLLNFVTPKNIWQKLP